MLFNADVSESRCWYAGEQRETHTHTFIHTGSLKQWSESGRGRREADHITSSKWENCLDNKSWKPQDSRRGIFSPGYWIGVDGFLTEVGNILVCLPFPRQTFPPEAGRQNSTGRARRVGWWSRRRRRRTAQYQRRCPEEWDSTDQPHRYTAEEKKHLNLVSSIKFPQLILFKLFQMSCVDSAFILKLGRN